MKYVIGNWKANKNINETKTWLDEFLKFDFSKTQDKVQVIICPPFPLIPLLREKIKGFSFIKIGSQDLSCFENGAYTGEVTAKSLSGMVNYSIIGHSERRQHFKETDEMLFQKAALSQKYEIEPVYCIRSGQDKIPQNIKFLAYEPVWAIGTGQNASPEDILKIKEGLNLRSGIKFIYGGSVTGDNAHSYLGRSEIDGVLPGGASLDSLQFYKIITSRKTD